MASGSSPRSAPSASRVIPAFTAVHDASSGRGAEDTPSQTIATATGPASVSATAKCIASSFRECRRPRSLTPATWPRSSSMWSLSATTRLPQDGQYPSSPATTGSAESVEHAVHILAPGESSRDVLIAESPLLSAWRHSARQDISLCPPGSGRHFFLFRRAFLPGRTASCDGGSRDGAARRRNRARQAIRRAENAGPDGQALAGERGMPVAVTARLPDSAQRRRRGGRRRPGSGAIVAGGAACGDRRGPGHATRVSHYPPIAAKPQRVSRGCPGEAAEGRRRCLPAGPSVRGTGG